MPRKLIVVFLLLIGTRSLGQLDSISSFFHNQKTILLQSDRKSSIISFSDSIKNSIKDRKDIYYLDFKDSYDKCILLLDRDILIRFVSCGIEQKNLFKTCEITDLRSGLLIIEWEFYSTPTAPYVRIIYLREYNKKLCLFLCSEDTKFRRSVRKSERDLKKNHSEINKNLDSFCNEAANKPMDHILYLIDVLINDYRSYGR